MNTSGTNKIEYEILCANDGTNQFNMVFRKSNRQSHLFGRVLKGLLDYHAGTHDFELNDELVMNPMPSLSADMDFNSLLYEHSQTVLSFSETLNANNCSSKASMLKFFVKYTFYGDCAVRLLEEAYSCNNGEKELFHLKKALKSVKIIKAVSKGIFILKDDMQVSTFRTNQLFCSIPTLNSAIGIDKCVPVFFESLPSVVKMINEQNLLNYSTEIENYKKGKYEQLSQYTFALAAEEKPVVIFECKRDDWYSFMSKVRSRDELQRLLVVNDAYPVNDICILINADLLADTEWIKHLSKGPFLYKAYCHILPTYFSEIDQLGLNSIPGFENAIVSLDSDYEMDDSTYFETMGIDNDDNNENDSSVDFDDNNENIPFGWNISYIRNSVEIFNYQGYDPQVIIPDRFQGRSISEIGNLSSSSISIDGNLRFTDVYIPDTVDIIHEDTFEGHKNDPITIHGLPGSVAEKAATKFGFKFMDSQLAQSKAILEKTRKKGEIIRKYDLSEYILKDLIGDIIIKVAGTGKDGRISAVEVLQKNTAVKLEREPYNDSDKNAIAVKDISNHTLGYIPANKASTLAPLLDSGSINISKLKVEAILTRAQKGPRARVPDLEISMTVEWTFAVKSAMNSFTDKRQKESDEQGEEKGKIKQELTNKCKKCGGVLVHGANFCQYCGTKVTNSIF